MCMIVIFAGLCHFKNCLLQAWVGNGGGGERRRRRGGGGGGGGEKVGILSAIRLSVTAY